MRDHIKTLGILNIIMGCFTAFIGIAALLVLSGVAGVMSWSGIAANDNPIPLAAPIITLIGLCTGAFFLLLGLPSILGGWGLIKLRPWARVLCIILSAFHLLNVPLGTALGVYGFWVLFSEEGRRILEAGSAPSLPLTYPGHSA